MATKQVKDFMRVQAPLWKQRWRWWHTLLLLAYGGMIAATFILGPLVAEYGEAEVAGRVWFVRLRLAVIGLIAVSVFVFRGLPWWRTTGYMLMAFGILMNIARNEWSTKSPLTLSFAFLLFGLVVVILGVALQPNHRVRCAQLIAENDQLRSEIHELRTAQLGGSQ